VSREGFGFTRLWLAACLIGLVVGSVLVVTHHTAAGHFAWGVTTVIGGIPVMIDVIRSIAKREAGVDAIAILAIIGCLALHEYAAGAVIAVMLASGQALEDYADRRAHRELSDLLERAPRQVHRYENGGLETRGVDEVVLGDRLFVKSGEVVPVDGVLEGDVVLDESALSGESRPVERPRGDLVRSGALNAGQAFDVHATATAADSTYAGIVRLVEAAQSERAPAVRLADRYAFWFIPITLVVAIAAWVVSGDAVRALSVLVVATPCPLILAVPIAIVAGISRAAKRGIIVKGGGALETVAQSSILLFDKTGTLTSGVPRLADVESFSTFDPEEVLRLAASLDQVSPHVLASAIVRAARERGSGDLTFPEDVDERYGAGITGTVGGRRVVLGQASYVTDGGPLPPHARDVRRRTMLDGSSCVFVGVDGDMVGALVIDDPIRPDTPRVIRGLRRAGIKRVVMVTGDHPDVAESVGAALGVDRILSERDPAEKVESVEAERADGVVMMVGDGLNDAPALAAADVGVAMGARGATASSEAADVVLTVDRLDRLVDAMAIAQRSRTIAIQSVLLGMGLAFFLMGLGAFGLFTPAVGALFQEAIDVASILNALRALGSGSRATGGGPATDVAERFRREHVEFAPEVQRIRTVADRLDTYEPAELRAELEAVRTFLCDRLPQHEEEEEAAVYPVVAKLMGGEDPMSSMQRAHVEIQHLIRVYRQLVDDLPRGGADRDDLVDLRRVLYGLHAILRLHFAQEEEAYAWLSAEEPVSVG
jgi:heavy metal translocating P-type ATPase